MGLNTQQDPIGIARGLNLYGYAGGDPINFSDPFGLCPPEDENRLDCGLGDIRAAHSFWEEVAIQGHMEGGLGGFGKAVAGAVASAVLDASGATAVDESARTLADPEASALEKGLAVGQVGLVVGSYATLGAGNAVAHGIRAGALQEVGMATRLLGQTGYRGSRLYGIRNAAGQAAGTDKHGFYYAVDVAGHLLHIGRRAFFKR